MTEVLERKVRRAIDASEDPESLEAALAWVPEVVAELEASGMLDDRLFAELYARSLHRSGRSRRMIQAKLFRKGVPRELADRALRMVAEESADMDQEAAQELARRRGFGAFRRPGIVLDEARRRKELGALARAGFSFAIAKKVVDATPEEL